MGLLTLGKALDALSTYAMSGYIRDHGITQFLSTYNRLKDISGDELRFGDEIECGIFVVDPNKKTVKLSVRSPELLKSLEEMETRMSHQSEGCTWHPEFGNWMIESTPSRPYTNYASDLLRIERNMLLRRRRLLSALRENEIAPYVTCFPLMGVDDFIYEPEEFSAPYSQSNFLPDYIVNPHPRFPALTSNIRHRRQQKVDIHMPLFQDVDTPEFLRQADTSSIKRKHREFESNERNKVGNAKFDWEPDTEIHMDAMGFGMGMCCLVS
jgi:glutamate--cysteine ligase catalytic subunit